jgi:hypothetical protein
MEQTQCLRTVAGADRAIPARALGTESYVPPLDLYLPVKERVAQLEKRLEESGTGQLIWNSCAAIAYSLQYRRRNGGKNYSWSQERRRVLMSHEENHR